MIVIVCYSLVALSNIATLKMLMMLNVSVITCRLRLDKGTETGIMATIHGFLRREHEDVSNAEETVQYGPSTCNKIERWWHELHSRLEQYFKRQLRILLEQGRYDPNDQIDR